MQCLSLHDCYASTQVLFSPQSFLSSLPPPSSSFSLISLFPIFFNFSPIHLSFISCTLCWFHVSSYQGSFFCHCIWAFIHVSPVSIYLVLYLFIVYPYVSIFLCFLHPLHLSLFTSSFICFLMIFTVGLLSALKRDVCSPSGMSGLY